MTAALDDLGAHLLGRVPSPHDPRDFKLADYLSVREGGNITDPLLADAAAVASSSANRFVKRWIRDATPRIIGANPYPAPTPPDPTPVPGPPVAASWLDAGQPVLDQGQTPRCVGFTGADWENELPVDDHVDNSAGDQIYAECKAIDGDNEDGSTIRSLAQALQNRGQLKAYAFAESIEEVIAFVTAHGPICWGIGWTDSMFTPDADGLVTPTGDDVGGHAITQFAYDPATDLHALLNHWGDAWGVNGVFYMTTDALRARLADGGEAMAAVEIA